MAVLTRPNKTFKRPPVARPRVPVANGIKQHANITAKGNRLIAKLEKAKADMTPGSFSISFQEAKGSGWLSSLVGVRAVDKYEQDVDGGRKMRAILMVRITGSGMKGNAQGQRTKRVPAYGVKPVTADELSDIEALLKNGPAHAKAAYKARHHKAKPAARA